MRRKSLFVIVAALILVAAAGVSLAYLTAKDSVENAFDVTETTIAIQEEFEPVEPTPGAVIKKALRVVSSSDADCYVRLRCVFTSSDGEALCEPLPINEGWTLKDDGYYYWNSVLRPGEATGTLFDQVQIKSSVKEEEIVPFDILVYAEASLAGGVDEDEAWTLVSAQK